MRLLPFWMQLGGWSQCILVWSIVETHQKIKAELCRIAKQHRQYTPEHCKMCRYPHVFPSRVSAWLIPVWLESPPPDTKQANPSLSASAALPAICHPCFL